MSGTRTQSSDRRSAAGETERYALNQNAIRMPAKALRRWLYFALVATTSAFGIRVMFNILYPNGLTILEGTLLAFFSVTFVWIVLSFWSAAIGFVLLLSRIDPLTLRRRSSTPPPDTPVITRTAVVMPIYNEDTRRVIAGFEASLRSLEKTGQLDEFDFYLLSDTQDPQLAQAERGAWQALTERLGPLSERVFYRRREDNVGRKVGNLADFCQRWGNYYHGMIVLDADSVMTGDCMLSLVHAMEANPRAGLIQTVPIPVRQHTFFGRFVQFAAVLYSPMLATGLAFWQTDSANYWGHNAIVRIDAFLRNCGLPPIPGRAPFGGDILSHDFVEAALLRRAGWDVILLADLEGSYEEVPSNILDYATRDRRWVQGNIQHLALLRGAGLHLVNRLHFLLGAVAYMSSLLWLVMLVLSTADAMVRALTSNEFFQTGYQLFPNWPIAKTGLIFSLLYLTAGLLLLPKLGGNVIAFIQRREAFGGARRLLTGTLLETVFAIIIAPLMMVFHAYFVVCVFIGKKVNWSAQVREGRMVPWREAFEHTVVATLVAAVWGGVAYYFTPMFFWWMTPVLVGLILAAPIVRWSSSLRLGGLMEEWGLFACPSETQEPDVLADVTRIMRSMPEGFPMVHKQPPLPVEHWQDMPIQSFKHYQPMTWRASDPQPQYLVPERDSRSAVDERSAAIISLNRTEVDMRKDASRNCVHGP